MLIKEFKKGETISGVYLIRDIVSGTTQTGALYLSIELSDKTGSINSKYWDASADMIETFTSSSVVEVTGIVNTYRNNKQLKISKMELIEDKEPYMQSLLETAPVDKNTLHEAVSEYLFQITNPNISRITRALLDKYQDDFYNFPAASKNHHEFLTGLAYHVKTMLDVAKSLIEIYPGLNKDLLYSGIILHDLGKIYELSGPISPEYTKEGKLLGHIPIGIIEIENTARDLNIEGEEVLLLKHMILSHHGKMEWGSPKSPMIKEAEVLHLIDNIDARITMIDKGLGNVEQGEFTTRIFPLESRSFYKPKIDE